VVGSVFEGGMVEEPEVSSAVITSMNGCLVIMMYALIEMTFTQAWVSLSIRIVPTSMSLVLIVVHNLGLSIT
jgi:hypothetical protein